MRARTHARMLTDKRADAHTHALSTKAFVPQCLLTCMSYMKQPKHSGRRVNGMLCIHISLHAPLSTFHFSLAHAHAHAYTAGYGGHVWCTDKV